MCPIHIFGAIPEEHLIYSMVCCVNLCHHGSSLKLLFLFKNELTNIHHVLRGVDDQLEVGIAHNIHKVVKCRTFHEIMALFVLKVFYVFMF